MPYPYLFPNGVSNKALTKNSSPDAVLIDSSIVLDFLLEDV